MVGFALEGSDYSAPGRGPAVVAALQAAGWDVEWKGEQRYGIIVRF